MPMAGFGCRSHPPPSLKWKPAMTDEPLCPFCGAYSRRACELEEEMGACPWEMSIDDETEQPGKRDEAPADEDASHG